MEFNMEGQKLAELGKQYRFNSENHPRLGGRPAGSKNRSTLFRQWSEVNTKYTDEDGQEHTITVEDKMILAVLKKACNGDIYAVNTVLDSLYGKITTVIDHTGGNQTKIDYSKYSDAELKMLVELHNKGRVVENNDNIQDAEVVSETTDNNAVL